MEKAKTFLPSERRRLIFEKVLRESPTTIWDLAQQLNVSEMTIRRDLEILENEGKVESVYGGVVSIEQSPFELSFAQRELVNADKKKAIGYAASQLVQDGEIIGLDGSTTTLNVARNLVRLTNLRVVTNGIKVATELGHRPGISVLLTGGELYRTSSLIGPFARMMIERLKVAKLFLSVTGVSEQMGLSGPNELDAEIKAAMIKSAEQVILLADSTKFGRQSYFTVAPLTEVDIVVSDTSLSEDQTRILENYGIKVILAQPLEKSAQ